MRYQVLVYIVLFALLGLVFYPVLIMISSSLKSNIQITTELLRLVPRSVQWNNYHYAWIGIARPLFTTIMVAAASLAGALCCASLASFSFAFHRFAGRELFYYLVIGLLMVPQIVTMIPQFILVRDLHLLNTIWVLIIPYTAGAQAFAILLMRSFFEGIPDAFVEAARMDGAGDLRVFSHIILPMSFPILSVLSISHILFSFNDFIWPYLTVQQEQARTFAIALVYFVTGVNIVEKGWTMAASVITCFPLVVLFLFTMRSFISGMTSAGIKG